MITPRWVRSRIQPIAIRDVLRYLVGCASLPADVNRGFDIGGPDVLTYERDDAALRGGRPGSSGGGSAGEPAATRALGALGRPGHPGAQQRSPGRWWPRCATRSSAPRTTSARYVPDPPEGLLGFDDSVRLALQRVQDARRRHPLVGSRRARRAQRPDAHRPATGPAARCSPTTAAPWWRRLARRPLWDVVVGDRRRATAGTRCRGPGSSAVWLDRAIGGPGLRRGRRHPRELLRR